LPYLFSAIIALAALSGTYFQATAKKYGVDAAVLEGICRYESGNGSKKWHRNKNKSWDIGFCQNHRTTTSDTRPKMPSDKASVREAARELLYWEKQHTKFCVKLYSSTGKCGYKKYGKWRGIKNCHRPHPWWGHYNWGFRVLKNNYDKKVQCFINNGFKKCKRKLWLQVRF